jgi:hypothetical protein
MFVSCQQTAEQSNNVKVDNKPFESVTKFKYVGTAPTNENNRKCKN